MTEYEYHTLNVFTSARFGGNPLAVFPSAEGMEGVTMQKVARELNLSETVFVFPPETPTGTRRIRIFTPGMEVPFAGHPTVGTAFFLADEGLLGPLEDGEHTVILEEGVGPVSVAIQVQGGRALRAELTAAEAPSEVATSHPPEEWAAMLGIQADEVGFDPSSLGPFQTSTLEPTFASVGLSFLMLPVASVAVAERTRLELGHFDRLIPAGGPDSRFIFVVAPGGGEADIHVRMYAPDIGVPEDPATGSATAALGGFLGNRLPAGSYQWRVEQGVEMGRPSQLDLSIDVDTSGVSAVRVGGSCVRVARAIMRT